MYPEILSRILDGLNVKLTPREESIITGKKFVDPELLKAIELNSTLADAHVVLATRYLYTEWDFAKAGYHLKRAMELNPNSSTAFTHYGWFLTLTGNNEGAVKAMRTAIEIDPTDPLMQGYLSWLYLWMGRNEEAIIEADKTLQIDPNYVMAYYVKGSAYAELGRYAEAIEIHKKGLAIARLNVGLGLLMPGQGRKRMHSRLHLDGEKP